ISRSLAVEEILVSARAQSVHSVYHRSHGVVPGVESHSETESTRARTLFCSSDDASRGRNVRRAYLDFRPTSVFDHSTDYPDGRWLGRCLVVLRAASIRRRLLGTQ